MNIRNVEFKARTEDPDTCENKLRTLQPVFIGTDIQLDTYFNVSKGRLKLREGNIENALINYDRENISGLKEAAVTLFRCLPDPALKQILIHQLGIKAIVNKQRRIYFIDNIKFHFDRVENLGNFVEVEATDSSGTFTTEELKAQCDYYFSFFELDKSALLDRSYSDMIMDLSGK